MSLPRTVEPEMLDALPADDPRAARSRRDLRRINRVMGTAGVIGEALDPLVRDQPAPHVIELGAGDGSLLLRIARQRAKRWPKLRLDLLDMQPVVQSATLTDYADAGWNAQIVGADIFDWFGLPVPRDPPIVVANLFVHHFDGERLQALVDGIASRARAFICCEPRRNRIALAGGTMLWALGCNRVTVHDGVLSVRAGFRGSELSALWPRPEEWNLREDRIGPFVHRFVAIRRDP